MALVRLSLSDLSGQFVALFRPKGQDCENTPCEGKIGNRQLNSKLGAEKLKYQSVGLEIPGAKDRKVVSRTRNLGWKIYSLGHCSCLKCPSSFKDISNRRTYPIGVERTSFCCHSFNICNEIFWNCAGIGPCGSVIRSRGSEVQCK